VKAGAEEKVDADEGGGDGGESEKNTGSDGDGY
jgi:hypothetical protein